MRMGISMRGSGSMIRHMDMALINMQMELLMWVSGLRISSMAREWRSGRMGLSMRGSIKMERNMAMDV